jgi:ubiquinone/menaquinone biosynthesis C-methylase UbiE
MSTVHGTYALGHDAAELRRLDRQAEMLAPATRVMLGHAGIAAGMRVLDLGTGTGDVARLLAEVVGPDGEVVGVDRAAPALVVGVARCRAAGLANVSLVQGVVATWEHDREFDAVVGRLILFHLVDPSIALAHHCRSLRPGGRVAFLDFDTSGIRTVPAVPLVGEALRWIDRAFRVVGANPVIGTRLEPLLRAAGVARPTTLGVTTYHPAHETLGPMLTSAVVQSLLPVITGHGIATAEEVGLDTLADRLLDQMIAVDAVFVAPTLVGAWGTVGD